MQSTLVKILLISLFCSVGVFPPSQLARAGEYDEEEEYEEEAYDEDEDFEPTEEDFEEEYEEEEYDEDEDLEPTEEDFEEDEQQALPQKKPSLRELSKGLRTQVTHNLLSNFKSTLTDPDRQAAVSDTMARAGGAVAGGLLSLKDKFSSWNANRKARKAERQATNQPQAPKKSLFSNPFKRKSTTASTGSKSPDTTQAPKKSRSLNPFKRKSTAASTGSKSPDTTQAPKKRRSLNPFKRKNTTASTGSKSPAATQAPKKRRSLNPFKRKHATREEESQE